MAGSMKDIKLRIKSVESTMQITKAMELVASSKMRRAKERVEHSRPYFETLHKTLTEIAAADPRARNPYLRRAEIKKTLLIVIAGDRGLAGGYNSNVLKQAQQEAGDVVVLPIGKRSAEYFVHHEVPLFTQEVLLAADITVGECFQLARRITEGYCKGEYDAVKICYTRFDSMMTQTASTMEVLPLSIEPTEQQKAEARRSQILYKPSSEEVFRAIIPEYVAGIVYGAVCESVASELAARRTAMDAATKNAGEMIDHLNLYYNRARQAAITQEITEIVAGAEI
ncbi:MAG: ATP synthase F1 subunit gamma [Faecalibacterium sp.]|jgi:F-type H+-transporting ATPase subunit gamma|nr:ATP synthase F1 subunit gamma [Faecalibacterium sp.]